MEQSLVYLAYAVAAFGAIAIYVSLPKEGREPHGGLVVMVLALALGSLLLLLGSLLGETGRRIYFYILAILAVGGAVRVVTHPRPVYAALFFVLVVLSTAGLMVLVGAEFLAAALVIVYAGGFSDLCLHHARAAVLPSPCSSPRKAGGRTPATLATVLAGFVLVGTLAGIVSRWSPLA